MRTNTDLAYQAECRVYTDTGRDTDKDTDNTGDTDNTREWAEQ